MTKTIMIQGTMSNAGKSLLTAGLCRIFRQDGLAAAPFKSQNMALNSYITRDGLEMGRAQVMQAEAAGVEPEAAMNPVLLKPTSSMGSQVIVNGTVWGNYSAAEYFRMKKTLVPYIMEAYHSLASRFDVIVAEGAGSPAEINLRENDIVNMGLAERIDAPVILVGDIDRGGVFAQLYGTAALLNEQERRRIRAFVINKFRGDKELLKPGIRMLYERIPIPVAGVVPWMDVDVDDEDSLSDRLENRRRQEQESCGFRIAVVRLPRISNFTDFNGLERLFGVSLSYVSRPEELTQADLIILPGTKNTMGDLIWLRKTGLEDRIRKCSEQGIPVFGICGGFQMLGRRLSDPEGAEEGGSLSGIGLLPVDTVFRKEKTTTRVEGMTEGLGSPAKLEGYEIHMGETGRFGGKPFSRIRTLFSPSQEFREDGCILGNVFGTYVHGVFDSPEIRRQLWHMMAERRGISMEAYEHWEKECVSGQSYKEQQYDKLADCLRSSLDMDMIYRILNER